MEQQREKERKFWSDTHVNPHSRGCLPWTCPSRRINVTLMMLVNENEGRLRALLTLTFWAWAVCVCLSVCRRADSEIYTSAAITDMWEWFVPLWRRVVCWCQSALWWPLWLRWPQRRAALWYVRRYVHSDRMHCFAVLCGAARGDARHSLASRVVLSPVKVR